jgi:deoxyadenosine/deoxycytidine kinase
MNSLVVNLFAGPSAGKSTMAAGLFYNLKKAGVNCELTTEFAKELTWENRESALDNQIYILGKQYHKLYRLLGQVDVIVTDTSFVYGCVYAPEDYFESYESLVMEIFSSMNNMNFFIDRIHPYNSVGRNQTRQQALKIDNRIVDLLKDYNEYYECVPGDDSGLERATKMILEKIQ